MEEKETTLNIYTIFALIFGSWIIGGVFLLKYFEDITWMESIILVTEIIQSNGLVDISGYDFTTKVIIFLISISIAAIEFGLIIFLVSILVNIVLNQQDWLMEKIEDFLDTEQIKQIVTIYFFSSTFFSIIVIKTIERIPWLDAIYYAVITISTVGFGDITAKHPISKIFTMVLVFNGITVIALVSQVLINRIVDIQISKQSLLPSQPLDYENHIIIAGYGSKGRRLAQLYKERLYRVVVVELDEDRARLAEFNGFNTINADVTKPALLDYLNLEKAAGLFLLLSDDNLVIQTGIISRSIAPDLDIYGEFLSVPTYNIARYAGINKPISLFGFLTNELQDYFVKSTVKPIHSLRELKQQETTLGFVQVPKDYNYKEMFDNPLLIGQVSTGLNEIYLEAYLSLEYEEPPEYTDRLLIAVDKDELDQKLKQDREQREINRLVFAGYSDVVESLIDRLDFPDEDIVILWNREEYKELVQQKDYKKFRWQLENGHLLLDQVVRDKDLVICSFDDITSSLIVGVTLKNLERDTQLIQLVPYEYDIHPLIKVGANTVFTPQQIISKAILGIFLKENNISPSLVYTNGHLYEHFILTEDDEFYDKPIRELNTDNFNVVYIRRADDKKFHYSNRDMKLTIGDRVIIFVKNEKKERLDIT